VVVNSGSEHFSQVVRTVNCAMNDCFAEENFVHFIEFNQKTGKALSNLIIDKLKSDQLDIRKSRSLQRSSGPHKSHK